MIDIMSIEIVWVSKITLTFTTKDLKVYTLSHLIHFLILIYQHLYLTKKSTKIQLIFKPINRFTIKILQNILLLQQPTVSSIRLITHLLQYL